MSKLVGKTKPTGIGRLSIRNTNGKGWSSVPTGTFAQKPEVKKLPEEKQIQLFQNGAITGSFTAKKTNNSISLQEAGRQAESFQKQQGSFKANPFPTGTRDWNQRFPNRQIEYRDRYVYVGNDRADYDTMMLLYALNSNRTIYIEPSHQSEAADMEAFFRQKWTNDDFEIAQASDSHYSSTPPQQPDNDNDATPWWMIVILIVAVVAVLIMCFFVYKRLYR